MNTEIEATTNTETEVAEITRLVGKELLAASKKIAKQSSSNSRRDLAIGCGYTKVDKKGKDRADIAAYTDAFLEASGVSVGESSSIPEVSTLKNGDLCIPSALFEKLFPIGTAFTVAVRKDRVVLSPIFSAV